MRLTTRAVEVETEQWGEGRVVDTSPGHFVGGVPEPKLSDGIRFNIYEAGTAESGTMPGLICKQDVRRLQVQVAGTSDGYRKAARYFLALAELDTSDDPDFHEHHANLLSADGQAMVEVIARKNDLEAGKRAV